ncbi:hypothetical protein [Streptomyces sp. NPDC001843]|uniref:hypothetical protein n=1 Tax=Streptomyces sp. NPDC001843 TaxID=3364617 RepID=UPI0036BDE225
MGETLVHARMPALPSRRRWLPLSVVAAATVTATITATLPAAAQPFTATAAASAAKPTRTPLGETKPPASTPVKAADKRRPLRMAPPGEGGVVPYGVGQIPWSEFYTAQLSDAVSAQVNYDNGNLLLTVKGFDIADAGSGLAWGNTFNSLQQMGWNTTTGADYRVVEATPSAVVVEGPTGTQAVFVRDGSAFTPAKGYKQDLTEAADKKSFTLTSRRTGGKTTFTRSGTTGDARVSKGIQRGAALISADKGASVNDAVRKTLVFSAILIVGGLFGCVAGLITGDVPPIVMGATGAACGVLLAAFSVLAHRKKRS